jgi:hypothetical protein
MVKSGIRVARSLEPRSEEHAAEQDLTLRRREKHLTASEAVIGVFGSELDDLFCSPSINDGHYSDTDALILPSPSFVSGSILRILQPPDDTRFEKTRRT